MRAAAQGVVELLDSAFLRALTEASRLEVLRVLLLTGTSSIGELAAQLPQDRSVISRHLQVLESAGIVKSTWRGRDRLYTLDGQTCLANLERIAASARIQIARCCPPEATVHAANAAGLGPGAKKIPRKSRNAAAAR